MPTKKCVKGKKEKQAEGKMVCVICGEPTVRLVDGEPSCDAHAALVYENQLEDYTRKHLGDKLRGAVE